MIRRTQGLTLLEIMVATAILSVVLFGFLSAITTSMKLDDVTRQTAVATQAARRMMEQIQAESDEANFKNIFSKYAGTTFRVEEQLGEKTSELTRLDAKGKPLPAGSIQFPTMGAAPSFKLREDATTPEDLGMPRDLNGDGTVDSSDHKSDYKLLPILVRAEWDGPAGPLVVEIRSLLVRRY